MSYFQQNTIDRLNKINWLSRVGLSEGETFSLAVVRVDNWTEARKSYHARTWENTTLEARNAISEYLHASNRPRFRDWNKIAVDALAIFELDLLEKMNLLKQAHELDDLFVRSVEWNVMSALTEDAYRDCHLPTQFFTQLLDVYESGRFPCGWKGRWPDGALLYF